ncbi:alpha-D-ribose 1-methylphosphonate 5-triphosphate diphosphatase [Alicyclobacillus fastidiosus]|uniref:Alpha-D-ribose 1-methylphosphonate 5-triphosphate diphosphatase n=1 Tax=Alicyclobacillus fastidiosus TaxID=392011 RepID=A0ABV5AAY0_9BACL|nr:alpha-D-ribose 1-methylphosphonate 5-triphosphate diphosphatase [Alicyclobacillus fastidiosus]WEH10911.1 alpha-D-ribose 1-methylphosphonate 5-triphosphate diphosphatase [Alicyclobacillus fastidiosus]
MEHEHIIEGNIVTPTGIIEHGVVVVRGGKIVDIDQLPRSLKARVVEDEAVEWVLPGMIDTHSDAIETEMQPRPGSLFPIEVSFHELERKLAAQGITTIYHALSMHADQSSSWARRNDTVKRLILDIRKLSRQHSLIRHRLHLRFEITNLTAVPYVEELLGSESIEQVSFMDHSPGQGQFRSLEHQKKLIMSKLALSEEQADDVLAKRMGQPKVNIEELARLAAVAKNHGIPLASHDDDSIEKLDLMRNWNVAISEFPVELGVAIEAKQRGLAVVMGAPNVVLGKSHSNNVSALEAISHGAVDILCSDYYPPSMLQAVFCLYRSGISMVDAVNLVSLNSAKALRINDSLGSIEIGKTADLLKIREYRQTPAIQEVYVEGNLVCQMSYRKLAMGTIGK